MGNRWLRRAACFAAMAVLLLVGRGGKAITVISSGGKSDESGRLAAAQSAIREDKLGSYGMTPIRAGDIADGVYEVRVASTSPFFKIVSAQLTVAGENMTADIRLGSESRQEARDEES